MAISRQSDSIWVEAAMGYGHQHSPASDHDHHEVGQSAREYGESLGRKHAQESIDHYNRDERGRFAPMPHHEHERNHEMGKLKSREHRDSFHESYHKGFTSKVKEHEEAEKAKANKQSSAIFREAVSIDPVTNQVTLEDPGRFHYRLTHGGSDTGYEPPSWLNQILGTGESTEDTPYETRFPTGRHPYRPETDTLMNIGNDPRFGLGLGLQERAPFSRNDVGMGDGSRKKENREYARLRPGELASRPIQVTDHEGNVHTFVHQVTAPNLNPIDPSDPKSDGRWVVSLHHHISRPDGTAEWLPSEVSDHVDSTYGAKGKRSDDLYRDIWGQLHANSDMVSMYGAGAQRVGDKHTSIEYEFPHPQGDVVYRAKLANGYNPHGEGYYYDPSLPKSHREAIEGGPQWIVTGRSLERKYPHDPNSPTHLTVVEGSDHPSDQTISFPKDDIPGVIDHVWRGLSVGPDHPAWRRYQQHQLPNRGGKPATEMIRRGSLPPWQPEHNIHRSAERLPVW